jgi:methylenetetrahydrofolate--tRNA-(uracil-5-)-methyltransferase
MRVSIIGAGLAGSEAAYQITRAGIPVDIYEMRPQVMTKAHKTGKCAELVCSNSFRGADLTNAVGLLKEELKVWDSLIMRSALSARLPAGGALAVDRERFSSDIDSFIRNNPLVTFHSEEITEIPEPDQSHAVLVATGPLTSPQLSAHIRMLTGEEHLAFYDAISPIILADSITTSIAFKQSRYDKGGTDDYFNLPMDREQYESFIKLIENAEKYTGHEDVESDSVEGLRPFEGCMPIEDMVARGPETLRHGPLKPMGLTDPRTGRRPYAVIQLRQDDTEGTLWSMVGFQTRMKHPEQLRVFRTIPGLEDAEFVRLGSVHRNTFINSPKCLSNTLSFKEKPGLFFAGQITGTEGYVESTAGGLVAGVNAVQFLTGRKPVVFSSETAMGSLMQYISDPSRKFFQPMNISFGLMPTYSENLLDEHGKKIRDKKIKRLQISQRALEVSRELFGEYVANAA